jgi:hypothetical protein
MAVLVEGISVIVRRDSIGSRLNGGWNHFLANIPNQTLCFDDEIARVGFMTPRDVEIFTDLLISQGLVFLKDREAIDIAVVDQLQGPTTSCHWLEFMRTDYQGDGEILVCWFFEGERPYEGIYLKNKNMELHFPNGWNYESSLSKQFKFIPPKEMPSRYKLLRRENGVDVFLDLETGEEVFLGRT